MTQPDQPTAETELRLRGGAGDPWSPEIRPGAQRIALGSRAAVEWKSTAVEAGPEGVMVSPSSRDGIDCLEIATPADPGWIRLVAMPGPLPRGAVLGVRLLLRVDPLEATGGVTMRPGMGLSERQRGQRERLIHATHSFSVAPGIWQEIRGVFACAKAGARGDVDLLVPLPRASRIALAALDIRLFEAAVDPGVAAELEAMSVISLRPFNARPVPAAEAAALCAGPVVYSAVAELDLFSLTGWALADDAPATLTVRGGAEAQEIALDRPVELVPGLTMGCGFSAHVLSLIAAEPEGGADAGQALSCHLPGPDARLVARIELPEQLVALARRARSAAETGDTDGAPLDPSLPGALDILSPYLVTGWARLPGQPGTPVPVQVLWQDRVVAEGLADRMAPDALAVGGYRFALELGPHGALAPEELRVMAGTGSAAVALAPTVPMAPGDVWAGAAIVEAVRVEGWVALAADGSPREVEVLCAGRSLWRGPARRRLGREGVPVGGFRVDLPPPEAWSDAEWPAVTAIALKVDGAPLGQPMELRPADRFAGAVELASQGPEGRLVVSGWLRDRARPLALPEIELRLDGMVLASGRAELPRADLAPLLADPAGADAAAPPRCGLAFDLGALPDLVGRRLDLVVLPSGRSVLEAVVESAADEAPAEAGPADATEAAPPPAAPDPRGFTVDGSFDTLRHGAASGWARYREAPELPVLVDLYVDNSYCYSLLTSKFRADVARKFGDTGKYGYYFELPPTLAAAAPVRVRAVPRYGTSAFGTSERVLPARTRGPGLAPLPPTPAGTAPASGTRTPAGKPAASRAKKPPKIAWIVLNRNGASLLTPLFESFALHNRHENCEILVVDHASTDDSLALCAAWADRLPIRALPRDDNHSFSASNNYGARATDAEIIVFLNNDIVFIEDVGHELVRLLADPGVGVVGAKLLDPTPEDSFAEPPTQHLGVHLNGATRLNPISPFETRYAPNLRLVRHRDFDVPIVTGALMACRRDEFLAGGGFDEGYFYGYEDVDLCLRSVLRDGRRVVCANGTAALHVRGFSRAELGEALAGPQRENARRLQAAYGVGVRRSFARDLLTRPGYWTGIVPQIGFAVTEASDDTAAGDYFTALELGRELSALMPCRIVFLEKGESWYDADGLDVLIVMRDDYDPGRLQNAAPHLLKVGWARNWFDRWAGRPWAQDYDLVWASSRIAADELSQALARKVEVVRIATNPARFAAGRPDPALASDYCFTGSYFGAPREIVETLEPEALPHRFAVFGHGWEEVPAFAPHSRGPLPYARMPDVYASTRIVIDDANHATRRWGSVNSRVFDSLAAGALVLTNGRQGAAEAFDGLLPSFSTAQELETLLHRYLEDEPARTALVERLQAQVLERHSYAHRARQVLDLLRAAGAGQLRFTIKIGAPSAAVRDEWGDWHFALALKRALTRRGHSVRIDCLDRWEGPHAMGDDVVIVLRGLSIYRPQPHQINLMWNISHPDAVSRQEYEGYDHVFVASELHAARLSAQLSVPVSPLLQCTDPELFHPDLPELPAAPGILFVGNSRRIYRDMVRHCVDLGLPVEIHGTRWEGLVPASLIRSGHIPNDQLGRHYRAARMVLNDHWQDMREHGFISNRIFDAAATGAFVVTDVVPGLEELFGEALWYVTGPEDLQAAVAATETDPARVAAMRRRAAETVGRTHSFDSRAETLCATVEQLLADALAGRGRWGMVDRAG